MGVADGVHVRPHSIEQQMHLDFGRHFSIARAFMTVKIRDDHVFTRETAFVHAGGGCKDAAVAEAHGHVTLARDNVFAVVHPATDRTDVAAVLFFRFLVASQH
jgi:hypothetical protein